MVEAAGGPKHVTKKALLRAMTGSALDIETEGFDRDAGAGILMAPGAVGTAAIPSAERNRAPAAAGTLPNRTLAPGAAPVMIDMATKFTDPNNDTLTYAAVSSDTARLGIAAERIDGDADARLTGPCPGDALCDRPRGPDDGARIHGHGQGGYEGL